MTPCWHFSAPTRLLGQQILLQNRSRELTPAAGDVTQPCRDSRSLPSLCQVLPVFHLGALGLALFPERSLQTLQMLKHNRTACQLRAGVSTRGRGLLLLDPSPNPAAVLGLRAAHLPVPFLPSPTEAHLRSQLQDGAAWGHQQVKVLSGSFRLRLARQGELRPLGGTHRGQGAVGSPCMGGTEHPHRENSPKTPSAGSFPPKCPRRGSGASTRSSPQGAGRGGAHSQLVGAAVVELELGADECPARLP